MSECVEFEFSLGETVRIKTIEVVSVVDGLAAYTDKKMYRVVYWFNGLRYDVWVYGYELEPIEKSDLRNE